MAKRPTPVRIDGETYGLLDKAAARSGRPITEEVRARLEASFERDAETKRDAKLVELQGQIGGLANQLQLDTEGPWHSNPFAFETFRAGVLALLDAMRPAGEPTPPKTSGALFGISDPEALGRAFAGLVRHGKMTGGKP